MDTGAHTHQEVAEVVMVILAHTLHQAEVATAEVATAIKAMVTKEADTLVAMGLMLAETMMGMAMVMVDMAAATRETIIMVAMMITDVVLQEMIVVLDTNIVTDMRVIAEELPIETTKAEGRTTANETPVNREPNLPLRMVRIMAGVDTPDQILLTEPSPDPAPRVVKW